MHSASPRGPPPASLPYCHTAVLPYQQHRPRVRESFRRYSVGLCPLLLSSILHPASCIMHTPWASFSKTGARYRVSGIGYRLSGTWDLVPGTGAGPTPRAEHRAPKTGPATGKRAHRVCIHSYESLGRRRDRRPEVPTRAARSSSNPGRAWGRKTSPASTVARQRYPSGVY